ncbi:MAG: hypothetical protein IJR62_09305 [Lachnospiraceae bacterium]|nr:hypothetical protein [Lachnospiraceae bacterium]
MRELIGILTREENVRMQYEILVMLLVFSVPALRLKDRKKLAAVWSASAAVFCYLHRILLPVLLSGLYVYCIAGVICVLLDADIRAFVRPGKALLKRLRPYAGRQRLPYTVVMVVILMIQLCRINIAVDYDSLRYGLRSDVLLTGGHGLRGFFENTGLVNLVYTYPKGFEVLTRPLYFGHTWGYVLCVNIWILLLILLLGGAIARELTGSADAEVLAASGLSLVPGITNMAVTAKSDLITLLCQLAFLYCTVCYVNLSPPLCRDAQGGAACLSEGSAEEERRRLTGCGLAALVLSYAFKPTALVFSSLIGVAALVCILLYGKKRNIHLGIGARGLRVLLPAVLFAGIMTARTWIISGMPFTSVFSGLFQRLGMSLNYPFRIQAVNSMEPRTLTQSIRFVLTRLGGLLLCPVGEDMLHVQMAWGGLVFTLMLVTVCAGIRRAPGYMKELNRLREVGLAQHYVLPEGRDGRFSVEGLKLITSAAAVTGIMSLLSVGLLYQLDGNYYMLLYALAVILGSTVLYTCAAYETSPLGKNLPVIFSARSNRAVILLAAVMIWFTACSGWAGPVGFTPVDPVNRGYYNHEAEYGITDPLHWDKHTRVIAFAEEPDCYLLKGRVESWVDIDGSGGNVYLTDTKLNIFKEYCTFAKTDYIYADLRFLHDPEDPRRQRADTLFVYMLEDGDFESVVLAENSSSKIFAKIDKERMAEPWEVPLSEEKLERTAEQCAWYESIGGYDTQ